MRRTAGLALPPQAPAMRADDVKLLIRQEVIGQQVGQHLLVGGIGSHEKCSASQESRWPFSAASTYPAAAKAQRRRAASSSVLRITVNSCGGGLAWVDTFSPQRHKDHTRQVWQSARSRAPEYHLADHGPGREA